MKTTSELARRSAELALRRMSGIKTCGERFQIIAEESQSALDAQAAQYREVIKVATDAFESIRNNQNSRDCAGIVATIALARISELTQKV